MVFGLICESCEKGVSAGVEVLSLGLWLETL